MGRICPDPLGIGSVPHHDRPDLPGWLRHFLEDLRLNRHKGSGFTI